MLYCLETKAQRCEQLSHNSYAQPLSDRESNPRPPHRRAVAPTGSPSRCTLAPPCEYDWTCAFFPPPESTTQTVNRSVQLFSHNSRQRVPILYNGTPFPPQNCSFSWGIWTPSNTWFREPTRVLDPNGISIGSAVFAGFTSVIDRPNRHTDRPRYSVGNNYRLHLRTQYCRRPNNIRHSLSPQVAYVNVCHYCVCSCT